MSNLQNFDLLSVGITVAAIGILGFAIFFDNRKSVTNKTFLGFSLITILYGVFNYINYQTASPELILWFLRLTIFWAVWHAFSFFQLFYVFPEEKINFPPYYKYFILPLTALASILTLTPWVFSRIEQVVMGGVSNPVRGPVIIVFGATVVLLAGSGIFFLIKKTWQAEGKLRSQLRLILLGATSTFSLIIVFNFILPVIFNQLRFIPLAPVFFFPLIIATAYAIFRHGLLNMKVVTVDILTFLLVVSILFEVLISSSTAEIFFRTIIFILLLTFGILLSKSIRREIKQREALQILTEELEVANEELRKLDQAKSEFISIASHQLRSPLTVIRGYIAMFREGTFGAITEQARDALGKVSFSAEQLIKLVASLLNLSRIESGKIKYDFTKGDFVKLVKGIVEEFIPYARDKGVELHMEDYADGSIPLLFDSDKIREVVVNLIDNAIKYSPKGKISVSLSKNASILLLVKDSGIGIAKEDIRKLFAKFSRSTDAQKVDPNGMGIGLYFVKRVVEDHGGKVWADSEGVGNGSTFTVELPIKS